jgi:UDP-glucose 4-epimerase
MIKKNILVTGSSGYIGQHLVKLLKRETHHKVYGIDNENRINDYLGWKNFLKMDIRYDIQDFMFNLNDWPYEFDVVIHLAALVRVNESVEQPYSYYNTNINGTANVLHGLKYKNFIFASTGAAENPISPYALSKRVAEDIVAESCHDSNYTIFRFYNVIGADGISPTNPDGLFSNLIKASREGTFNLYGTDYNTPDGTPVRDYVHVNEICRAIMKAIDTPANGLENLGHGKGHSVQEMITKYQEVNNTKFDVVPCQRREGDLEYSVLKNVSSYMEELYTFDELMKL